MTRTEKENLVPVWERITISLEEAAAYSGIGVRKLRDMTDAESQTFSDKKAAWEIAGRNHILPGSFSSHAPDAPPR